MVRTKKQAVTRQKQESPQDDQSVSTVESDKEHERKSKYEKIKAIFRNLSQEEIDVMLMDCAFKEDEVIQRLLNRPEYLEGIRRIVSAAQVKDNSTNQQELIQDTPIPIINNSPSHREPTPDTPIPIIKDNGTSQHKPIQETQISNSKKPPPPPERKKRNRAVGRLALDDALRQIATKSGEEAFEGWSEARIRAYQMIDKNPNSYYYRFNAPGEEQRKGPWTEEERKLFFKRLAEVGANGQWGIFSTAIPGRVGYQCSNYYRLLIESGEIHDPNYVLDEKGKAHYLFDKKCADGRIEKTFRTHSPHTFGGAKKKRKQKEDDDSGTFKMSLRSSATARSTSQK